MTAIRIWITIYKRIAIHLMIAVVLIFGYPLSGYCEKAMELDVDALMAQSISEKIVAKKKEAVTDKSGSDAIAKRVADEIREDIKNQVKEEIKSELTDADEAWLDRMHISVPEWTRRIRLSGDIRVRYEGIYFDDENYDELIDASDPVQIEEISDPTDTSGLIDNRLTVYNVVNIIKDYHRYRLRGRFSIAAEISSRLRAAFRFATGKTTNPISTNTTLGDYLNKKNIVLDQAYLKIMPVARWPETIIWAGRFPNPWISTDLIWDGDLGFEGAALTLNTLTFQSLRLISTIGAFPIQHEDFYTDKWLLGGQLGFEYKPRMDLTFMLAAAYYDFQNTRGERNDPQRPGETDWTAPLYQTKGNTLFNIEPDPEAEPLLALAADYQLINATGYIDMAFFFPIHIKLIADYVENIGFDEEKVSVLAGTEIADVNNGYKVELLVGHPKVRKFGEWQWSIFYKYVEADAVMDAFTDSDFYLGGTNSQGWALTFDLGLMKNFWLSTRWITSDSILDEPQVWIDQLQVDLNAKF